MTAEIGVLNRYGVALAADSAVTVSRGNGQKVLNTANKLFTLSKYNPIGIMVYQSADFMGIPWETLIKLYRDDLDDTSFDKLNEACEDFINFIGVSNKFVDDEIEKFGILNFFNRLMLSFIRDIRRNQEEVSEETLNIKITNFLNKIAGNDYIGELTEEDYTILKEKYETVILNDLKELLKRLSNIEPDEETKKRLFEVTLKALVKTSEIDVYSGIVISGFGEKDIFPSLYHYHFMGLYNGKLKYKLIEDVKIKSNTNIGITASINAFAQKEMVNTFIEGISPAIKYKLEKELQEIFCDLGNLTAKLLKTDPDHAVSQEAIKILNEKGCKIYDHLLYNMTKQRRVDYINPVIDMLESLPKEDLGFMAETLVSLTSFKRRLTLDAETVGGPIDVAVITKGDGFIWLKRKQYFDHNENHHFISNYFYSKGGGNE